MKPETFACPGHGTAKQGGIARLDYLMTYWVVSFPEGDYRAGPYPTRPDAERALSAAPR